MLKPAHLNTQICSSKLIHKTPSPTLPTIHPRTTFQTLKLSNQATGNSKSHAIPFGYTVKAVLDFPDDRCPLNPVLPKKPELNGAEATKKTKRVMLTASLLKSE